jgi:hypothetical protein
MKQFLDSLILVAFAFACVVWMIVYAASTR